ncbi:hypothetical protein PK28_04855 [Hymenobacter sp. DG25B]|uniref:DUF1990 family protein n=1 Tax=Hymenobacter sp. DG25B TaxID=1385664 RepID=UPI0005410D6A|nr:DUF1990 family protein [Hymenobacter sp. DG25B]AIZ63186.1 hypothetical protein PK28_04855 [Hymenobacter sp. DG25B]
MNESEQPASVGSGPLLERRYYIDMEGATLTADELLRRVQCDVPYFSPDLLAEFEKRKGTSDCLQKGDEFSIKILGPWNGTVRVTRIEKTYFEFVTLEGHPEAGRIRFSVRRRAGGKLRFEIHSWARSRDGLVSFAYDTLGVGKRVQENTWRIFCERVAEASGGQALGPVIIETIDHDHAKHDVKQG